MARSVECSELSQTIADIALAIGARPGFNSIDSIVVEMRKELPELTRAQIVDAIAEATTGEARTQTETQKQIAKLKREAKRTSEPTQRKKLLAQIAELQQRVKEPPVAPVKREEIPQSKELRRLQNQRDLLRQKINQRIQDLKPRSILSWAAEPINLSRSLLLGIDFGQVLRQGKFALASHPILTAKNLPTMFRAFAKEGAEVEVMRDIEEHDLFPVAKKGGLELTHGHASLYGQEEIFRSIWSDKLPVLKNFNRAYRVLLNKLRWDVFRLGAQSMPRQGEPTAPEAKIIANAVNVSSGRGAIHNKLKPAMVALNQAFLAPQHQVSRFQAMIGQPLWGGGVWRGTSKARIWVAKEYARTLIGLGFYYSLWNLAGAFMADDEEEKPTVEFDPRSSDFGKIRMGDTRIDPLAGVAQWVVFAHRMALGQTKSTRTGKVTDIRGPDKPFAGQSGTDVAGRFLRGRLAPAPVAIWDRFIAGETPDREDPTLFNLTKNMFLPITPREVYKIMREEDIDRGTVYALFTIFGEGVRRYDDEKKVKSASR